MKNVRILLPRRGTCPQLAERAATTLTFRRGWATKLWDPRSTGPIATPVGPPGALACSRLKSIIQASQFNVVAAPTPGGGGRPEGPKPPPRVSYAVQKPAGTPFQWVAAGGGRI